jgi:hypothetical protein
MARRSKRGNAMANDYDAMPIDDFFSWKGRTATSEATHRDGYVIVSSSRRSCPHRWIDNRGPPSIWSAREAIPTRSGLRARDLKLRALGIEPLRVASA